MDINHTTYVNESGILSSDSSSIYNQPERDLEYFAREYNLSYNVVQQAIIGKRYYAVESWKYYYLDFLKYKEKVSNEIKELSTSKCDLQQHWRPHKDGWLEKSASQLPVKLLDLLEKERKCHQAEKNLKFIVDCETTLIQHFRNKVERVLLSATFPNQYFIDLFCALTGCSKPPAHLLLPDRSWELLRKNSDYLTFYGHGNIKSKLALRFANYMMDNQHLPPFHDHFRSCNICRLDGSVFLKEYLPGVASGKCAEKLKTWELLVLELCDLELFAEYFAGCDNHGLGEGLQLVRAFHTSSLK